jgi:hypothetical protein
MKIEVGRTYKFVLGEYSKYTLLNDSSIGIVVKDNKDNEYNIREVLNNNYGNPVYFVGEVMEILHKHRLIVVSLETLRLA